MIQIKSKSQEYIPETLREAIEYLKNTIAEEEKEAIKNGTLDPTKFHHSFGRSLRNSWELWQESELAKWFNERGIGHADDMSGIILESFKRELQNKEIELDEQIAYYRNYWKENGSDPDNIGNLGE